MLAVMAGVVDETATSTKSPYPPTAVSVIVEVPVLPGKTMIVEGLAEMVKSGVATIAVWLISGADVPAETMLIHRPETLWEPTHPV